MTQDNTGPNLGSPEPKTQHWWIYRGTAPETNDEETTPKSLADLPAPPPWRDRKTDVRGAGFIAERREIEMVNTALYLRRPLLITGRPGVGKSTLAYAIAQELGLEEPLVWPINTRSTLASGLYRYDAVGRLQRAALLNERRRRLSEAAAPTPTQQQEEIEDDRTIGQYLRLGPMGTALATSKRGRPRVLLLDEIDKSDLDLPNDLLNVLEEGLFDIPELSRLGEIFQVDIPPSDAGPAIPVTGGRITCQEFPVVLMTSNGERDFPPAFLRRCLRLTIPDPSEEKLTEIVRARLALDPATMLRAASLIREFHGRVRNGESLATDQLLNAVYLALHQTNIAEQSQEELMNVLGDRLNQVFQRLDGGVG